MGLDLGAMSLADLKALQADLHQAIRKRTSHMGGRRPGPGIDHDHCYVHPADCRIVWSGQGRPPRWFLEAIASGLTPDDMLILLNADAPTFRARNVTQG